MYFRLKGAKAHRTGRCLIVSPALTLIIGAVIIIATYATGSVAHAQNPYNALRIAPEFFVDEDPDDLEEPLVAAHTAVKQVVIDTDPGVDDIAAIAGLLSQTTIPLDILGIVTVAGNTTVENATRNIQTLLAVSDRTDIRVIKGASQPLTQKLSSTGKFVHGPDGLWGFQGGLPPSTSVQSQGGDDASNFYCRVGSGRPGATILAIGPLTNLAKAIRRCPDSMRLYAEIIVLGGAKFGGNTIPNAEFNFWQDPEAAQIVLEFGVPPGSGGKPLVKVMPLDTFNQMTLSLADAATLQAIGTDIGRFVALPLSFYICALNGLNPDCLFTTSPGDLAGISASVADLAAAAMLVAPNLGTAESSLVKVVAADEGSHQRLARGLSAMAIGLEPNAINERILMIANDGTVSAIADSVFSDPGFDLNAALGEILASDPDNASVFTNIRQQRIRNAFLAALTAVPGIGSAEVASDNEREYNLYIPLVENE